MPPKLEVNGKLEPAVEKKSIKQSAREFADLVVNEGSKIACDETTVDFRNLDDLPPFYDEELFKKGQKFFHDNLFSIFLANSLGLVSVLSEPSILKMIMWTRNSSTDYTSYKRYAGTILHMFVWYSSDFKPGSKLWRSLAEVKQHHNSASKRGSPQGMKITQKDMTLTQFGFIGVSLCRSKMLAIDSVSDEEWKGFVHLWRVIGYLIGTEDRFNLCHGTVEETRERCNALVEKVFLPNFESQYQNKDFLTMTRYMVVGLWSINTIIRYETIMCYLHMAYKDVNNENNQEPSTLYTVTPLQKLNLRMVELVVFLVSLKWTKLLLNKVLAVNLWFMRVVPVLGAYQFGLANAKIRILVNRKSQ